MKYEGLVQIQLAKSWHRESSDTGANPKGSSVPRRGCKLGFTVGSFPQQTMSQLY